MNRQRLVPGHFRPAMMSRAAVGVTIGVAVRTGREALRQAVAAFDDLALQESVVGAGVQMAAHADAARHLRGMMHDFWPEADIYESEGSAT